MGPRETAAFTPAATERRRALRSLFVAFDPVTISVFGALLGMALTCALGAAVARALGIRASQCWLPLPRAGGDSRAGRGYHPAAAGIAD